MSLTENYREFRRRLDELEANTRRVLAPGEDMRGQQVFNENQLTGVLGLLQPTHEGQVPALALLLSECYAAEVYSRYDDDKPVRFTFTKLLEPIRSIFFEGLIPDYDTYVWPAIQFLLMVRKNATLHRRVVDELRRREPEEWKEQPAAVTFAVVSDDQVERVARRVQTAVTEKRKRQKKGDAPLPPKRCAHCPNMFVPGSPQKQLCPECDTSAARKKWCISRDRSAMR